MGMVYKVQGDMDSLDFNATLEDLSKKFIFMYLDDTLFLALKSYLDESVSQKTIKKILKTNYNVDGDPNMSFAIIEINKNNISKQSDIVKDWCLNSLVRLDTQKYEDEKQESLKSKWIALDKTEQILQQEEKELSK